MEEKIVRLYYQYNPWWESGKIPDKFRFPYKRPIFEKISKLIQKGESLILVGPRRVGKTVLLYQLIENLISERCDPNTIFYLACDDPSLVSEEHPVADAIKFLEEIIFRKSLKKTGRKFYLIFDEIQGIKKWAEYFKKYLDLGYPVSFLASGSSSISMTKTTRESLVGRAREIFIYPFSFREFLELKYKTTFKIPSNTNLFSRKKLLESVDYIYKEGLKKIEIIKKALNAYFIYGGFPETYNMEPDEVIPYLKMQVIERVLYRDIPEVVPLRNPYLLRQLLIFISSETANIINFTNLSSRFSARYETISTYLFYLESSFLINTLKKYSKGGLSRAKSWPKVHIQDPAIANSMLNMGKEILIHKDILGRIAESMVVSALLRSGFPLFYWRERDKEVDIVLEQKGKTLPMEVKFKKNLSSKDLSGILSFQKKYKPIFRLIITQDKFKITEDSFHIPLWTFLLLLPES